MKKRLAGLIVVAVGLAFVVASFAADLYRAAPAFERMTDGFRKHMTQEAIARYRSDITGLTTALDPAYTARFVRGLAETLGMTETEFNAYLTREFPAVASGLKAVPQIGASFSTVLATLNAESARFASADAIPTSSLPATTLPWAFLGVGLITIVAGGFLVAGSRAAAIVASVLALALILVPLALSLPTKASDADTMNAHLKPVYTAQLVAGGRQSLQAMQAMGTEMQTKMIPALAQALRMTPEQAGAYFASSFPAVSRGLQNMPTALARFGALVGAFDRSLPDYNTLKTVSMVPLVWLLIGGGIVMFVASIGSTRQTRAPVVTIGRASKKAA